MSSFNYVRREMLFFYIENEKMLRNTENIDVIICDFQKRIITPNTHWATSFD